MCVQHCRRTSCPTTPCRRIHVVLLMVLVVFPVHVLSHWMSLGLSSLAAAPPPVPGDQGDSSLCNSIPGLNINQLQVCQDNPQSLQCIQSGARRAMSQCQTQFKYERWNCTTPEAEGNGTDGTAITQAARTRETAFVYAVLSAGLVHAVTESCTKGKLSDCSCDERFKGRLEREGWRWGGCSDNIRYGVQFAKRFVDTTEIKERTNSGRRTVTSMVNLHNNNVGRFVVLKNMAVKCRCHGVSGSCAVKTCWRAMPAFNKVGEMLKKMYARPVAVAPRSRKRLRRRERSHRKIPITNEELVYISRSPNYCRADPKNNIVGTVGRVCQKNSTGAESCNLLCCGRGYNTQVVEVVERCNCRFHWCCHVTCSRCKRLKDVYTCK